MTTMASAVMNTSPLISGLVTSLPGKGSSHDAKPPSVETMNTAVEAIKKESSRARRTRNGEGPGAAGAMGACAGATGNSCLALVGFDHLLQWMRFICEGTAQPRGNADDSSDSEQESESD